MNGSVSSSVSANQLACRWWLDGPADGVWNMAVDETLLLSTPEKGVAALRFYQWSEPTLSLGYFQRYEDRRLHGASLRCPVVRRASGGGAILHDRELTYSFVVPTAHPLAADPQGLYLAVHEAICDALSDVGIAAHVWREPDRRAARPGDEAFLCFQRRGVGDLLVGEAKVAGSAQRRHRGAILQHGSVLLAASPYAPELLGLAELAGQVVPPHRLAELCADRMRNRFDLRWEEGPARGHFAGPAAETARQKFADLSWTHRR